MCLWGIIHGRRFVNNHGQATAPQVPTTPAQVVKADGRRVALTLTAPQLSLAATDGRVFVYFQTSGGNVSWTLDKYNQSKTFLLEEWGSDLLQEVLVQTDIVGNTTVYFTDVLTNEPDELLAYVPRM